MQMQLAGLGSQTSFRNGLSRMFWMKAIVNLWKKTICWCSFTQPYYHLQVNFDYLVLHCLQKLCPVEKKQVAQNQGLSVLSLSLSTARYCRSHLAVYPCNFLLPVYHLISLTGNFIEKLQSQELRNYVFVKLILQQASTQPSIKQMPELK